MNVQVFHLEARSPFRIGKRGVGLEAAAVIARADTLFSALCTICREWYGLSELRGLLEQFKGNPAFLLSSGYPYIMLSDQSRLRFYPRLLTLPPGLNTNDPTRLKSVKKITFVSESIFKQWVEGDLQSDQALDPDGRNLLHDGRVWVTLDELEILHQHIPVDTNGQVRLWHESEVPRVTVDRASSASQVFQSGRVRFAPGGGLWVAFHWLTDEWPEKIEELLMVLGDSGLGGERSIGHGQFSIAQPEEHLDWWPDAKGRFVTLSPYWPSGEDEVHQVFGPDSVYSLSTHRGWIGSPEGQTLRRKSVRMFDEGSVLSAAPQTILGGLADVTPKGDGIDIHDVLRYGYAMPVGIKGEKS